MGREDDEDDAIMLQAKQQITNNVITKRKEQLRRWQSSEMNGESSRRNKKPRVQFQDSDIFLSACMSGDEEEVEELLSKGADINTCTIDGLTALHQSVIDSKPDMVRFLCEKGADLNAQDNEGWTPLHAAACCGNVSIVQYLCQKGADLTIVNSDKELPLDLADDEQCRDTLEKNYERQKIDVEACRDRELATMMHDVQTWINVGEYRDVPHVRTGGTAMHVAAARGYTQLLELLVKAGGNVHARDKDGWTPLHAAAHWAERDACKILIENNASVSDVTFANQDVLAVADKEIVEYLEELAAAQAKNDRRKSPSVPVAVLQDKNHRSSSHEEHIISAEKKKEIQHKDQISENEILHKAPAPKMAEFSPSRESSSSATTVEKKKIADIEKRSPSENSRSSVEISPLRSSVEKSPSVPRSVDLRSSERESTSRESSLETRTSATASTASSAAVDRSPTSSQNSQRSVSLPPSASPTTNESRSSAESSSLQSGDQEVSATLPMVPPPRALNQSASSWINRGVQLISRSTSSSRSGTSSASGSTEPSSTPPPSATVQPIVTASSATTSSVPSSATPPVSAKQSPSPAGSVSVTATFTRPP
ncbi:unnamed protein product [Caenorhabditis auriculariae]|uniref:ANK_REP_REGION domain-containing protein n=1 Tax=Caenorhabditis auriculariae TaxID=2777116 RepID=A0A8S1HSE8_9PELO|nr:unnamed protein product [Caenorhabditis auriculariae]